MRRRAIGVVRASRWEDQFRRADRLQRGGHDAVRERLGDRAGDVLSKPGLADPTGTDERHDPDLVSHEEITDDVCLTIESE